jgi:hypothetical protein
VAISHHLIKLRRSLAAQRSSRELAQVGDREGELGLFENAPLRHLLLESRRARGKPVVKGFELGGLGGHGNVHWRLLSGKARVLSSGHHGWLLPPDAPATIGECGRGRAIVLRGGGALDSRFEVPGYGEDRWAVCKRGKVELAHWWWRSKQLPRGESPR